MNEFLNKKKESLSAFLYDYGKVISVVSILITSSILLGYIFKLTENDYLRVTFLNIGQGDAILIQTPSGHDMLIDGGPSDKVLEKLNSEMSYFDRRIDVLVSTHPDADHITGLIPVLKKYDVGKIIVSPISGHTGIFEVLQKSIDDEKSDVHVGTRGDEIIFGDGVTAHILYPNKNYDTHGNDTNDASVSLMLTYGDESVLLTGDLPSTHEDELLQNSLPHDVTIYKAGHHGSKYSSGEQLLSYIRPKYAVISAGEKNKYGHPNLETLDRLKLYAKEIVSTIDHGTISFELDGKNVHIETDK